MKSVRDSINPNSVIATLAQMFRTNIYSKKIIVVVEGDDDKKLFSKFFKDETSYIHPIGGCTQFTIILDQLNEHYESKFFVLKDADFDHLNNVSYSYSNLFLTDMHDAETMMINKDTVKNICCEFFSPMPPSELIEKIFNDLEALSYLKWYNSANNFRLNFKIIKLTDIYFGDNPTEFRNILQKLYSNVVNSHKGIITIDKIQVFYTSHQDHNIEPRLLINGHDLCEAIIIVLKKLGVTDNIKKEEIPRCLRCSYNLGHFKLTKLFKEIHDWSMKYDFDILYS